jgi:hypothetical protein
MLWKPDGEAIQYFALLDGSPFVFIRLPSWPKASHSGRLGIAD